MIADTAGFKLTVVICDAAQAVGGKLYILGGGWSRVLVGPDGPIPMTLAVVVSIPWTEANEPLQLRARLLDANNDPVVLSHGPVEVLGQMEAGRPPGLSRGTPLDSSFVLPFAVPLDSGIYVWEVSIVDRITEALRFEVIRGGARP